MCGAQCAETLRGKLTKGRKALTLIVLGAVLLCVGWALSLLVPCIKHIFTVSFTCQAMGWCVLALALLYVITDVLGARRGWWLLVLYGQCAFTAYLATHFFKPTLAACTRSITQGLPRFIDKAYMPLANAIVTAVVLTLVLLIRRRLRGVQPVADESDEENAPNESPTEKTPANAPAFKSHLMSGAIAERFQIPGMESKAQQAASSAEKQKNGEAASQAPHVKTKLKIH